MASLDLLRSDLQGGRERFLALVADIRHDLHRYCTRMTGSVSSGEDVVQETLAKAYYSLGEVYQLPQLRSWLFQIAHSRCVDYLRRYDRRLGQPLETVEHTAVDQTASPEDALAREEAVRAAISTFLELPAAYRSCVILKDVLGHSVEEIAVILGLTVPTVKAALHRGRTRLRSRGAATEPHVSGHAPSPALVRYAALFNARDWNAVRAMLAEDVRLDLVARQTRSGKHEVGGYLSNYAAKVDWRFAPAWLDGREVLAGFHASSDERPSYFIELTFENELVTMIRDYRYVPYIAHDAELVLAMPDEVRLRRPHS
ncbi:MAG TPA: sigma-70 family RNA polymerase sigma factor [Kofleriaceae bacterium]|jgi:RNA polymerase sigma-70 factor (ECF subfamily)